MRHRLLLSTLSCAIISIAAGLQLSRRSVLAAGAGGCCCVHHAPPACALADLVPAPLYTSAVPAVARNAAADSAFANTMANGMQGYERAVAPIKQRLFSRLLAAGSSLPAEGAVIVELGVGTFPNAPFYADALRGDGSSSLRGVDLIGIDPNEAMAPFAQQAHSRNGLGVGGASTLRVVRGVAEALPLADNSADAVVCTLTLCSVVDPAAAVREVVRVLKPGGSFVFLEHVLSEDDPFLASQQVALTPLQVVSADGCHLDRRTLETVRGTAGFKLVDAEVTNLKGFWYLSPTAAGVAVKA